MNQPQRVWADNQKAVFDHVDNSKQHLVIQALAGSGKTTTIVEALYHTRNDESVLLVAFNKAIAEELKTRAPADVDVRTLHSFGFNQIKAARGKNVEIHGYKVADMVRDLLGRSRDLREVRTAVAKLVSYGKAHITDMNQERRTLLTTLNTLADNYGLFVAPKRDRGVKLDRGMINVHALEILRTCAKDTTGKIDFDDMIWLPIVQNLPIQSFDRIFVDETQDLNATQLEMILRAAGDSGQIIAVGDENQSIYQFRGADSQAMPRMIETLKAKTLPLSITYRCAKKIVEEANEWVPALTAKDGAAEGKIDQITRDTLIDSAAPGDFVISRTNAELVSLCLTWIAQGKKALIRGKAIGDQLISLIRSTDAINIVELRTAINGWQEVEAKRLEELNRNPAPVHDTAACICALIDVSKTVDEVCDKISALFVDDLGAAIQLMSTHKSKGLEAEKVFLLRDTYLRWPGQEEENLLYVAITRAKSELVYVTEGVVN